MASVRLTNEIREGIVDRLVKDSFYQSKLERISGEIKVLAAPILEEYFPKEVMKMFRDEKYKLYFKSTTMSIKCGDGWRDTISLDGDYPQCGSSYLSADSIIKEMNPDLYEKIQLMVSELRELIKNKNIFRNKLKCTMEGYNSTNQLKKDFPEAHEAFQIITNGFVNKKGTGCDQVEELRAVLSFKDENK